MANQFGLRLRELRTERSLLQKNLEEVLNLRPGTISQYERGLREPGFDLLLTIADKFAVSTDYLLGRPEASQESPALLKARRQLVAALAQTAASGRLRLPRVLTVAEEVAPGCFSVQRLSEQTGLPLGPLKACKSGVGRLPAPTVDRLHRHLGLPPEWPLEG